MKHLLVIMLLVAGLMPAHAQKAKLYAGPIVGSVTSTSAKIWIGYHGKGKNAVILGDTATKRIYYPSNYSYLASNGMVSLTFDFTGLQPGHIYNVIVSIEGWKTHPKASFRTQYDTNVKDFSFNTGSCALLCTDWLRPVFPGGKTDIFTTMRKHPADFMLWLGDNIYYLESKDYKDQESMFAHNMKVRSSFKQYKTFLSSTPHYAIWDDHDYGPNDADKSWRLKDTALSIFKSFWPNTYPEQPQFKGNYFSFRYYDAEFFMLDDRYFRDAPGDSSGQFLGETQMVWLKNKLQMSDASFKFIAIGTQVLNDNKFGESYKQYPKERLDLFQFLSSNNIKGVIFLTGDKHYTEICKRNYNDYPIIDFTCSPLTSPVLPRRLLGAYDNPTRVPGMDYGGHNYGRVSLSGPPGDRICTLEVHGRHGKKRRELVIHQSELQRKKP